MCKHTYRRKNDPCVTLGNSATSPLCSGLGSIGGLPANETLNNMASTNTPGGKAFFFFGRNLRALDTMTPRIPPIYYYEYLLFNLIYYYTAPNLPLTLSLTPSPAVLYLCAHLIYYYTAPNLPQTPSRPPAVLYLCTHFPIVKHLGVAILQLYIFSCNAPTIFEKRCAQSLLEVGVQDKVRRRTCQEKSKTVQEVAKEASR
jgi:hypothetical protein